MIVGERVSECVCVCVHFYVHFKSACSMLNLLIRELNNLLVVFVCCMARS